MAGKTPLILTRPPKTDDELWFLIVAMFGIRLPRVSVCPDHISPFEAVAHAFFGREPNFAVWYASRGSGKSLALAVLGLVKAFVFDIDVTILGGSMTQSLNVREHMRKLMDHPNAPTYAVSKDQATLIQMNTGKNIRPLPASQTTVRGPHPPLQLLDECFAGSTSISTTRGPRRIETIVPGDTVLAWTDAGLMEQEVLAARQTGIKPTVVITLANGTNLVCTGNHPIMTDSGWVAADALDELDSVLTVREASRWAWQGPHRRVPGLLAGNEDREPGSSPVQRLRWSLLGDCEQGAGAMQRVQPKDPGGAGHQVRRLRDQDIAALRAVPALLAQTPVDTGDDRTHGPGQGHRAQDESPDQQGRAADGRALGLVRADVRAVGGVPAVDPGLRAEGAQARHRGPWIVLARQAISSGARRAQASVIGRRRLHRGVRQDGSDAVLVAVRSVRAGPTVPVFNLTVAGAHTYLAGGVVVHNCDEMEYDIYNASLGQAMEQLNVHGEVIQEYIVASSTWQNPDGTFSKIIEDARERELPIFTWCWRELLEPHGWMTQRFVDNKRKVVSAQMWKTEYELNEPSAGSRAFDLDKVERYTIDYPPTVSEIHKGNGDHDEYLWEKPLKQGLYAVGADWAKEKDKTVIVVVRYDITPHRLVKLIRVNRRPWDAMIAMFNKATQDYQAVAEHDGTGIGNVVADYVDYSDTTNKFVMIGRKRTEMLLEYITDVEHGMYLLPHIHANLAFPGVTTDPIYRAHRAVTVADVYAPGKWNSHLPDDIAAMALAHRALKKLPMPTNVDSGVPRDDTGREVDKRFTTHAPEGVQHQGEVTIIDERYSSGPMLVAGENWDPWEVMSL